MNSYERAYCVLTGEVPDRVPSFEIMIDPKIMIKLTGSDDYADFCDYIDMDIVITNTPSTLYRNEIIDKHKGIFKNEWGIIRQKTTEVVSSILDPPLKTKQQVKNYIAPDPYDEFRYQQLKILLNRFKGKRLVGMHLHDAFNYPYYLRGMENLFIDMYEDADLVKRLVDISVQHNIAIAEKAIDMGADFILLGDDYGASNQLLVSPSMFREFFLPGLKQIVHAIKAKGAFCIKHCCGNINSILDDMIQTGIDALHPLDPSAGMDIKQVKNKYDKLTVIGGINCYKPLTEYSTQQLEQLVKDVLDKLAPGARYIMSSSNSIHSDVKPENFKVMQDTLKKYGVY